MLNPTSSRKTINFAKLHLFAIVFMLSLLQKQAQSFQHYHCAFDQLYNAPGQERKISEGKPDEVYSYDGVKGRGFQAITRNPIRITLDTNDFNSIKSGTNGAANTNSARLAFVKRTMLITEKFFQTRLKVSTIARIFAPTSCEEITTTQNDRVNGISSSDLHIYVIYITDGGVSYGATAVACKYVISLTLPDATLQQGRPTFGRIKFNTYSLVDQQTSLTNRLFATVTATALHETMHILGFDSSRFDQYLNPNTGNVYGSGNYLLEDQTLHPGRTGGHNDILITPNVKQWAIDFFACGSLDGMALENEDGSPQVSSHWERLAMYDELMTATQLGAQKGFSGLTFALLKDMGWYEVDDSFSDTSNYGYHMGCDFYNDACHGATDFDEYFCDPVALNGYSVCATNFLSKSICTSTGTLTDGCGIFGAYFHCVDPASSDDGYKSYTLEKYQTDSFCIDSTLANLGLNEKLQGRCYPYRCLANSIKFTVGVNEISCEYDFDANPVINEAGDHKIINSLSGYLQCPVYEQFCEQSRKICPNWCSQNGFCTRGVCNCYSGYYGDDCSKTLCTTGEYYDESSETCVTFCPSGTYQNQYSRACLPCSSQCQQCRDDPDTCTGCLSTPQLTLYYVASNQTCMEECPSDTYQDVDDCIACDDTGAECKTCIGSPTQCTSCLNNKFLEDPVSGACITTCPDNYRLYDVVNYKCVDACTDNLIYYTGGCTHCPPNTDGICDYCPPNEYKFIQNQSCVTDCPPTYYENDDRQFCQKCDLSCLECDGGFAENCTACNPSRAQKYLLLKMCVSSCPRGFYPNDDAGVCEVCLQSLNCATCQVYNVVTGAVRCLTCLYGYYFKESDSTCNLNCDPLYFKNKWNHSCDACPGDCGDCLSFSTSACTNCQDGKKFLTNISGGYCLDTCPTQYYTPSGNNCLDCYLTCKTCDGVSSSSCTSCIDGLFLSQEGMCRYVCPSESFPNPQTGTCDPCHDACTFCFGPSINECTACIPELVLNNFTCATSCPDNLTINQWRVCSESSVLSIIMISFFLSWLLVP